MSCPLSWVFRFGGGWSYSDFSVCLHPFTCFYRYVCLNIVFQCMGGWSQSHYSVCLHPLCWGFRFSIFGLWGFYFILDRTWSSTILNLDLDLGLDLEHDNILSLLLLTLRPLLFS